MPQVELQVDVYYQDSQLHCSGSSPATNVLILSNSTLTEPLPFQVNVEHDNSQLDL